MQDLTDLRQKMKDLRCCVIIPTYNHEGTLESVVRDVEDFTEDIIIVNDGSTDQTAEVIRNLSDFRLLTVVTNPRNRGKGYSLRKGFAKAIEKGYRYAITIDSDGQHFAEDIPGFIEMIDDQPDSFIIGAREMNKPEIPGTSNFGHRFSIFWFLVETGLKVKDVQSGYRLYPLDKMKKIIWFTTKYEFEVEAMVRLAWRSIPILSVPIEIYYAPPEERVSHFRKFHDFARTSLLNIILIFLGLLWFRPLMFIKRVIKMNFRQFIKVYIIDSTDSNIKISLSVGLGIMMGCSPFWGWQMVISYALARILRLNRFVTVVASNISIPPLLPLILFLSYISGGLVMGKNVSNVEYNSGIDFAWVKNNLFQYLIGSVIFGVALGLLAVIASFILLEIVRDDGSKRRKAAGKSAQD